MKRQKLTPGRPLTQTSCNFLGAIASGATVVGFCLLLLCHDPLVFWNDDYQLSILPVFADVARSWSEGHLPLLSPYSWICGNLAGEFQYGTFSIFVNAVVVFIWKFPLTFPQQAAALSIAHLFVLAAGGFLLARDRKISTPFAMMVALVAALNGWIICWGATDWFGALGAFAWLPWAWWGLERSLDRTRSKWRFLWPTPFVYLLITGGFPYTVLMLGLLTAWLVVRLLRESRRISLLWPLMVGLLLGVGLAAPSWLALLDYIHGSARQAQPSSAHFQWLVPLSALPGFILPCWTVNWVDFSTRVMPHAANEMSCGLIPPLALLGGLIWHHRLLVRRIKWELGLLSLVLVISILPSANVFRWSFRWLPFFHLILVLCAAEALQSLVNDDGATGSGRNLVKNISITGFVIIFLVAAITLCAGTAGSFASPLVWIFIAIGALWVCVETLSRPFGLLRQWTPAGMTFAALLASYLCIPPNCGVPRYNLSQTLNDAAPLDPARLYLSIYPPPEITYRVEKALGPVGQIIRPGSTSMWGGVHLVNGYSPIRPAGVAREFGAAIHGEVDPATAEYFLGWQAGAEGQLAQLGIDGILIAAELDLIPKPESEWRLVVSSAEGRLYHRRGEPFARVRSLISIDPRPNEQFVPASIQLIEDSRNRMAAEVDVPAGERPALLAISRPYFKGYRARIGTQRLEVNSYRGLMPILEVVGGTKGRLILEYRPWWLIVGGTVSICCAATFLACVFLAWRARAPDQYTSRL